MRITGLDHLVITVRDVDATCAFYREVLGMQVQTFGNGRLALKFGRQKINIHEAGHEIDPKADRPTPGSVDLCLLVEDSLDDVVAALDEHRVDYLGPVSRTGADGAINSVYVRDPDRNLIELSRYDQD
ncbi:VOC family protein [Bifidobacterium mellis]|uniref:Glyoxalase/bleomycin resistance protein/dioxygenase n=1 Tax=Bifidobacterium mellis TaxID=1293823 RepID=A0A0F4KUQ7_9BIFI|nr:VOC family protein [Bifidobacterium mellis]KJY50392.1 Glyoxalase/bleomycin resistance protein/dioxygenase [Bifidobacterium mellis]